MAVEVVSAAVYKQAAADHAVEHRQVKLNVLLERCNKALNDKIKAFRQNKGLNEITLTVTVQYMFSEFDVVDDAIEELKKAGYSIKKDTSESRDEDFYWLKIFAS